MIHSIPVENTQGAGGYMSKYMQKEFNEEVAKALGMVRRWSNSRKWPGRGKIELKHTRYWGWHSIEYHGGYLSAEDAQRPKVETPAITFAWNFAFTRSLHAKHLHVLHVVLITTDPMLYAPKRTYP